MVGCSIRLEELAGHIQGPEGNVGYGYLDRKAPNPKSVRHTTKEFHTVALTSLFSLD
jgi:hypothetical protein